MEQDTVQLSIAIDNTTTIQINVPKKMNAMEFAGFMAKMNFMKSIAQKNLMSTNGIKATRRFHKWTDAEKAFIKKNPTMKVGDIRKALKLDDVNDHSVYAIRAEVLKR